MGDHHRDPPAVGADPRLAEEALARDHPGHLARGVDQGQAALGRGRRARRVDEGPLPRDGHVGPAVLGIVADPIHHDLGGAAHRQATQVEGDREQAARAREDEMAAFEDPAVRAAFEDEPALARLQRDHLEARLVVGTVLKRDREEDERASGNRLRPAVGHLPCRLVEPREGSERPAVGGDPQEGRRSGWERGRWSRLPPSAQAAPRGLPPISARVRTSPVPRRAIRSLRSAKKATARPSGANVGCQASSVPGSRTGVI